MQIKSLGLNKLHQEKAFERKYKFRIEKNKTKQFLSIHLATAVLHQGLSKQVFVKSSFQNPKKTKMFMHLSDHNMIRQLLG